MSAVTIPEPLFYHASLAATGDALLSGAEARHAAAQRLRAGDAVALFNGRGDVARGSVRAIGRDGVHVRIERRYREAPPRPRLELYSAVPKGDRVAVMLDMATQLGMTRFTPLRWRRSVVEPNERARERWQRICIEACKQSRRVYVPDIAPAAAVAEAAAQARGRRDLLLVAHPGNQAAPVATIDSAPAERLALFIGPEGGMTDEEVELLRDAGARFVRLGAAILRIETAAVALIATAGAFSDASATRA